MCRTRETSSYRKWSHQGKPAKLRRHSHNGMPHITKPRPARKAFNLPVRHCKQPQAKHVMFSCTPLIGFWIHRIPPIRWGDCPSIPVLCLVYLHPSWKALSSPPRMFRQDALQNYQYPNYWFQKRVARSHGIHATNKPNGLRTDCRRRPVLCLNSAILIRRWVLDRVLSQQTNTLMSTDTQMRLSPTR